MQKPLVLMGIGIMVMVAGCGTQTATSSPSKPASSSPASAMTKPPTSGTSVVSVKEIQTNKTAQMVEAGNPATFVLTAKTTAGHRASGVPVTFYVGPMILYSPPLGADAEVHGKNAPSLSLLMATAIPWEQPAVSMAKTLGIHLLLPKRAYPNTALDESYVNNGILNLEFNNMVAMESKRPIPSSYKPHTSGSVALGNGVSAQWLLVYGAIMKRDQRVGC